MKLKRKQKDWTRYKRSTLSLTIWLTFCFWSYLDEIWTTSPVLQADFNYDMWWPWPWPTALPWFDSTLMNFWIIYEIFVLRFQHWSYILLFIRFWVFVLFWRLILTLTLIDLDLLTCSHWTCTYDYGPFVYFTCDFADIVS